MPAFKLKLASTFVLALVEEKLYSIEFLVLFYTTFPKDFGEAQNCQKNASISLLDYSTWQKQGTSLNRLLCFSDVLFTCYGKLGEFMPASKLASTFVLALIEEKSAPLNFSYFSTQLSLKILAQQSKLPKICLHFTVEVFNLAKARDFPESASVFQ